MIKLEHLKKEDFNKIVKWNEGKSADFILQWSGPLYKFPMTETQIDDYFEDYVLKDDSNIVVYKIVLVETGEMVGTIELKEFDKENKIGRVGRFLIGEESCRGKGIGRLALKEVVRIGFEELGFDKVTLAVFDFNQNAIKCYENVGFVKEKLIENARKAENGYWNLYEMCITREQWKK
jgi:RimJ/RimL family protein N-acetyltransferase